MSLAVIWYVIIGVIVICGVYILIKHRDILKPKTKVKTQTKDVVPLIRALNQIKDKKEKGDLAVVEHEVATTSGKSNALMVNVKMRKMVMVNVQLKPEKNYGRQWDYAPYTGIYFLKRNLDGSIEPTVPSEVIADSPTELYEAIQTFDDVREVFGWQEEGTDKFKLGMLILASVIALFIMFMAVTYKGG